MSTTLLLHFEGADNSTTFTDSSATGLTVAPQGSAKISTTAAKFTAASGYFNGTTDYLTVAAAGGAWSFGTGDWTAEAFVNIKAMTAPTSHLFGDMKWNSGVSPGWFVGIEANGAVTMYCHATSSTWTIAQSSAGLISASSGFVHIATVRISGVQKLYVGGVLVASVANTYDYLGANPFRVGSRIADGSSDYFLTGYVDELRVENGEAIYTDDFTPPTGPIGWSAAEVSCPLATLSAFCGGYAQLSAPSLMSYSGVAVTADVAISPPPPTLSAYSGAVLNSAAPTPTLLSIGHNSYGEQAAFLTLPSPTVAITTGANAGMALPSLTAQAAGTVTGTAKASIGLPSLTASTSATVSAMGNAALSLPAITVSSYTGALCSITIGAVTTQAIGTTGGIGRAQVTLPLFEATATATAQNHGGASISLPSISVSTGAVALVSLKGLTLTALGTAVVTATYEAYAVNLKHTPRGNELPTDEVTRYTNFPFTHVVRHKNSYYGVNSTGLYLLEGTTDDATPIPWAVKTAMTDFKSPEKKTVASAYFGGRFGPASTVQLHAGEQTPNTYSFATPRDDLAQNHRQVFGKGLKERYFALGASGTGVCEIDSIELDVRKTNRRI